MVAMASHPGATTDHRQLDPETVELHQRYHEKTLEYTMEHMDWLQSKGYGTDKKLNDVGEQVRIRRAARSRFWRWPRLDARDMHQVRFCPSPQRFTAATESAKIRDADPAENVFVVSLPRRPSKLKHVLQELHTAGVSATVVDAVDGDAILCQQDLEHLGVRALPGYAGHSNHNIHLTTGEVGCFMSHYSIWTHMVEQDIQAALILEDDFDFQPDFVRQLGQRLEEIGALQESWNLLYIGRSPVQQDVKRLSRHIVQPGYTLWTVAYILTLDGAKALLEAKSHQNFVPLDEYFSIAMGRYATSYNEFALDWARRIPRTLRSLAVTPPLVMPYVGSMFLSDTAMMRPGTRYVKDLPMAVSQEEEAREMCTPAGCTEDKT